MILRRQIQWAFTLKTITIMSDKGLEMHILPVASPRQVSPRSNCVSPSHRQVYSRASLVRLLQPESIAIVGASPTASSFGALTRANLDQYAGRLYLVNSKYASIGDRPCHPSVADLPESPDCVVVAVARESVEPIVHECVARKVGGIVIYASGYAETGKSDRIAQQARLTEIALASGIPIVGPNVMGQFNFARGTLMSFVGTLRPRMLRERGIGVVSQSGALGVSLCQAAETGVSISHLLLSGNSCDFDVADAIAYLAEDPSCQAIACVFEGMPDPLRLLEAGERASAFNKPVVVYDGRGRQLRRPDRDHRFLRQGA
ncbi:MAG: hypothetical protein EBT05_16295 [Betaproteobacteria bacterium]|nr:hypothetical protein [Betaproteobacteria bacterium]